MVKFSSENNNKVITVSHVNHSINANISLTYDLAVVILANTKSIPFDEDFLDD